MNLLINTYTVESQLDIPCIQRGGSFSGADDSDKILKGSVHFHHKSFILEKKQQHKGESGIPSIPRKSRLPQMGNVEFEEQPGNPHL